ncbi:M28 family peptidase [Marinigracilibium pacificum]|uniref:M28 family peptidase n=1 Tax=Marinigracilibium pacificum TaxID=2729599 RepID=A0A848J107_9BACT|nr:M28 family peptidase [Marinigracilibium pacificum]NMM48164.1 M28 family peptidase [Marinigracilibium pacificum]
MNNRYKLICIFLLLTVSGFAQTEVADQIAKSVNSTVSEKQSEEWIYKLASDDFGGRGTGSAGIDSAANMITSYWKSLGVKPMGDDNTFKQAVGLKESNPGDTLSVFQIDESTYTQGEQLLYFSGNGTYNSGIAFVGYGSEKEIEAIEISGKIVLSWAGSEDKQHPMAMLEASSKKIELVKKHGGIGLIELYKSEVVPWPIIIRNLNKKQIVLDNGNENFPYAWLNYDNNTMHAMMSELKQGVDSNASIKVYSNSKSINAYNLIGKIEGTDPSLKDQYVVVSAHYDHLGIGRAIEGDSIYNGARDNALGVAGIMNAAKYFSKYPPKRSVLLIAFTAEEMGLLGSIWYADHPVVPLNKTVFNLNADGAGYNDTTKVTIIGLNRTNIKNYIYNSANAFGIEVGDDPAPEQNLFDRSDNASFARKGVPCINMAPGMKSFNQEIFRYYHNPADEASSLNYNYLAKYWKTFVGTAAMIANSDYTPYWMEGDSYESRAKVLYGIN